MLSYRPFEDFGIDAVKTIMTGTEFGVVHPKSTAPEFCNQVRRLLKITGKEGLIAQKLAFNTLVTRVSLADLLSGTGIVDGVESEMQDFLRTAEASDGIVVSERELETHGLLIMNADCGVIKIFAPEQGLLAFAHAGYNNLDNPKTEDSVVTNAVKLFKENGIAVEELYFQVGEAARFSYGFNDPRYFEQNAAKSTRIANAYGADTVFIVEKGPRKGGFGFDTALMAARQAEQAGIRNISLQNLDTALAGKSDELMDDTGTFGDFYSNLMAGGANPQGGGNYRNATVVYI